MTQKDLIRDYIERHGTITPFEAFTELGCTKLATRISEMRADGEIIFSHDVKKKNRYGKTVIFCEYGFKPFEEVATC